MNGHGFARCNEWTRGFLLEYIFPCSCFFSTPRYRYTWQYADQTIAYFAQLRGTYYGMGCGSIRERLSNVYNDNLTCSDKLCARFLCETGRHVPAIPQATQFPEPPTQESHRIEVIRLTPCPEGHLTHEFLACDVQSSCQARDTAASGSCVARDEESVASCRAALTPLPPSFPCSNGRGQVPYTLVCDHRPDCGDNSDETFCVFLPCDSETQFDCGNRQVYNYDNLPLFYGYSVG